MIQWVVYCSSNHNAIPVPVPVVLRVTALKISSGRRYPQFETLPCHTKWFKMAPIAYLPCINTTQTAWRGGCPTRRVLQLIRHLLFVQTAYIGLQHAFMVCICTGECRPILVCFCVPSSEELKDKMNERPPLPQGNHSDYPTVGVTDAFDSSNCNAILII